LLPTATTGLLNASVYKGADAAIALLVLHIENTSVLLKIFSMMVLRVAYSGSHHEDVLTLLLPVVVDDVVLMVIATL
jgi:26S proteasome regulatory subunit N1